MVKKRDFTQLFNLIISVLGFTLAISFVLAAHTITTSSGTTAFYAIEDTYRIYNFTINNTDNSDMANITTVNITIPSGFSFVLSSNGTNAGLHSFSNTSNVLTWSNSTFLVMNLTWKYFWFNATASTPGTYNFTIRTSNSSFSSETNISITVNDTTAPLISIATPANSTNSSNTGLDINFTVSDASTVSSCWYTNDTNSGNTTLTNCANITTMTWIEGQHNLTIWANDTANNVNLTTIRFTTDTTAPSMILVSPPQLTNSTKTAYNFTFNVSDAIVVVNCSLIYDGAIVETITSVSKSETDGIWYSSVNFGTHTWSINCTDAINNIGNSSTRTLLVDNTTAPTQTSSSGGGSSSSTSWYVDYFPLDSDLSNEKGYTKDLPIKYRVQINAGGENHYVGLLSLTGTTATIQVSSTPQQAVFNIGDEKKFEITGDNYYDIYVKLNGIANSKANVTIKKINEAMPAEIGETTETSDDGLKMAPDEELTASKSVFKSSRIWILVAGIIFIIIIFYIYKRNKNN